MNRPYREMDLQLRNKSPKSKDKAKLRGDRQAPSSRNDVWAMDFVHDQLFDATKVHVLTVVNSFTHFAPAIEARYNWRGSGVVGALERGCGELGFLLMTRVDQGPEFISKGLDLRAYRRGVVLDLRRPGKPPDKRSLSRRMARSAASV